MLREQERSIAVQDGGHKVLSGAMDAADYFEYYVDQSLFDSSSEYVSLVNSYVEDVQS